MAKVSHLIVYLRLSSGGLMTQVIKVLQYIPWRALPKVYLFALLFIEKRDNTISKTSSLVSRLEHIMLDQYYFNNGLGIPGLSLCIENDPVLVLEEKLAVVLESQLHLSPAVCPSEVTCLWVE